MRPATWDDLWNPLNVFVWDAWPCKITYIEPLRCMFARGALLCKMCYLTFWVCDFALSNVPGCQETETPRERLVQIKRCQEKTGSKESGVKTAVMSDRAVKRNGKEISKESSFQRKRFEEKRVSREGEPRERDVQRTSWDKRKQQQKKRCPRKRCRVKAMSTERMSTDTGFLTASALSKAAVTQQRCLAQNVNWNTTCKLPWRWNITANPIGKTLPSPLWERIFRHQPRAGLCLYCKAFFSPNTPSSHWGVLTARVKASAWSGCSICSPAFFL